MITEWAAFGLACGVLCGGLTRTLLTAQSLGWQAWAASAATTGGLFAVLAWRVGCDLVLVPYSYLAAVLVVLAVVDLVEQRLPSVVVLPSYPIVFSAFLADSIVVAHYGALWRSLAGMAILVTGYLALALIVGGLGAGDIKLAGLLGLALGWSSWTALLIGTFLGWLFAAARVAATSRGRVSRGVRVPMGPYLALGTMVALIMTPSIGS